LKILIPA